MTGPKGNSEFCLSQGEHCSSRGNKLHRFLRGQSFKCFVMPPDSKLEKKKYAKMICLALATVAVPAVRAAFKLSCATEMTPKQSFSSQLTKNIDSTKVALPFSNA